MNIYELAIAKSTPKEVATLVQATAEDAEKYRKAFEAARAVIECHVADPNLTEEMIEKYAAYNEAKDLLQAKDSPVDH